MHIGNRIKELRKMRGLLQSELAKMSDISRVSIGNYERGDRIPNIETLIKISNALKVDINDLLNEKELFTKELLTYLESVLLNKYKGQDIDSYKIISDKLKIKYEDLENAFSHGIDISQDDQLKLFNYLLELNKKVFYIVCENNMEFIKSNKVMYDIFFNSMPEMIMEFENIQFESFKNYLVNNFDEDVNDFGDDKLRKLWEYTNKILKFELQELKNKL